MMPGPQVKRGWLTEPLEYRIEYPAEGVRIARIQGVDSRRDYGAVNLLVAQRIVAAANACTGIPNPGSLPLLSKALTRLFEAKPSKQTEAINNLLTAAQACGIVEEDG